MSTRFAIVRVPKGMFVNSEFLLLEDGVFGEETLVIRDEMFNGRWIYRCYGGLNIVVKSNSYHSTGRKLFKHLNTIHLHYFTAEDITEAWDKGSFIISLMK